MELVDLNMMLELSIEKLEILVGNKIKNKFKTLFVRVVLADNTVNQSNIIKLNDAYHLNNLEGLETYGDAILDLFVCKYLFGLNYSKNEITTKKSEMVCNKRLNLIGGALLGDIIIDINPTPNDEITYAKALERLVGAMYEAYGSRFTRKFLKEKNII